jgi:predicted CXXCH cytochrome family protein
MKAWTFLASIGAAAAALAISLSTASGAAYPVQNSKHNLNVQFGAGTVVNNEVCLPCHAPHSQPDKTLRRLWNHVMPNNTYTLFGTGSSYDTTLDETSRKCLSCHDGTVAPDAYGQGGGIHAGQKTMPMGFIIGVNQNLTHEHPVGVKYPGMNPDGTWTTQSSWKDPTKWNGSTYQSSEIDPNTGTYKVVNYTDGNGVNISTSRGLSLAKASTAATTDKGTIVGCGTCHTPHSNQFNFLRISNANSQLCLTCHDK